MSKLEEAAKEYSCKAISFDSTKDNVATVSFKAGALYQAEQSKVLEEALEYCFRHGYICNHDDSSWCNDKCNAIHVAKDALKKYRESKGGG